MTGPVRRPAGAARRAALLSTLGTTLLSTLLAACTTLPSEGPVTAATDAEPGSTSAPFDFNPPGPRPGASPEEVVLGFLNALQATPATTQVAEEFLTGRAVTAWRPGRRTVVYDSEQLVSPAEEDTDGGGSARSRRTSVVLELTGTDVLDASGRWLREESGTGPERLVLRLRREGGEWRLANPPDGVVVPETHFASRYRQYALYYFDPTATALVPEPVYLPWGVQAPTQLLAGLLDGPPAAGVGPGRDGTPGRSDGAPAVARTYLPPGTRLGVGVPVVEGVADVPLSDEVLELDRDDLDLAMAQIAWTLRQVTDVERLRVTVDGTPLELPDGGQEASVSGWDAYSPVVTSASTDVFGLRGAEVRQVLAEEEITAATLGAVIEELGRPRSLGVDMSGQQFALVAGNGAHVGVVARAEGSTEARLLRTSDPLRPMWDHAGLLWVVDRTASGAAVLVRRGGDLTEVAAPGLTGRQVVAAALSRDGSRLAALRRAPGGADVVVARVLRSDRGVPVRLTQATRVSGGLTLTRPVSLGWRDPVSLAVLTRPARRLGRVVLLPADGATTLPAPRRRIDDFPGAVRSVVASPGGPTALLLWDAQRRVHALEPEGSWDLDVFQQGLRAPTFVG